MTSPLEVAQGRYLHEPVFHAHVTTVHGALIEYGVPLDTATDHALLAVSALFPTGEDRALAQARADALEAIATEPILCQHCSLPIRGNPSSSTGWEHYPSPPDPTKGWQGVRCPGRLSGAEPI